MNEVTQRIRQRLLFCLMVADTTLIENRKQEEMRVAFSCSFSNNVSFPSSLQRSLNWDQLNEGCLSFGQ